MLKIGQMPRAERIRASIDAATISRPKSFSTLPPRNRLEEMVPYEEFRKVFENQKPLRWWERITLESAIKWMLACALVVIAVLVR